VKELAKETELGLIRAGEKICDAHLNPPYILVPFDVK